MKGVMRFGKKGKLCPRYVGAHVVLQMVRKVSYEFRLPIELALPYPVFQISMLEKLLVISYPFILFKG